MKENTSALYSEYIIDGIQQSLTPAEMLLSGASRTDTPGGLLPILDESIDPDLIPCASETFPMAYASDFTRQEISIKLIDAIWRKGHFRIGDTVIRPEWIWNTTPIGNMAAFYWSAEAAADYADSLGIRLSGCSFKETDQAGRLEITVEVRPSGEEFEEDILGDMPFRLAHPKIFKTRMINDLFVADPKSWIIFIPFRTDWETGDPDYFLDCYELVRELVEDRIILSGATAGTGGLKATLEAMSKKCGVLVGTSSLEQAFPDVPQEKLLSDSIPGAVIQINDADYDYIDAEFLLQEVAYFPLGHPSCTIKSGVRMESPDKTGIRNILESIIKSQTSEGED